jgi:hypothetical protein
MDKDSDPFKDIITRLMALYTKVKTTEEIFYAQLGLPEGFRGL